VVTDMHIGDALIGFSGYVGTTLRGQAEFEFLYNTENIRDIAGVESRITVCAAAPAQKWIANRDPEADRKNIEALIANLKKVSCQRFVLISTVDVFGTPIDVNEDTDIDETDLHAYGLHRRELEKFVASHFSDHLIVRLPGLVGPGLRKNVAFDFLNDNNLHAIDSRGSFQFYPMVNLWYDIQTAMTEDLKLVHLTAEPVTVSDIAEFGFGKPFDHALEHPAARYDMQSIHAELFGGQGRYQYSRRESLQAIRAYAQSETPTVDAGSA
jgi:hypothetical protein